MLWTSYSHVSVTWSKSEGIWCGLEDGTLHICHWSKADISPLVSCLRRACLVVNSVCVYVDDVDDMSVGHQHNAEGRTSYQRNDCIHWSHFSRRGKQPHSPHWLSLQLPYTTVWLYVCRIGLVFPGLRPCHIDMSKSPGSRVQILVNTSLHCCPSAAVHNTGSVRVRVALKYKFSCVSYSFCRENSKNGCHKVLTSIISLLWRS